MEYWSMLSMRTGLAECLRDTQCTVEEEGERPLPGGTNSGTNSANLWEEISIDFIEELLLMLGQQS